MTGITDKEIIKANRLIGIDHFFSSLPNGYYTEINSNVGSYSLGRLISIDRAILTKAEIIVLDEPDSTFEQELSLQIKRLCSFYSFKVKL